MVPDINECASAPCMNGGDCNDRANHYTCNCAAGYHGARCETGEFTISSMCVCLKSNLISVMNMGALLFMEREVGGFRISIIVCTIFYSPPPPIEKHVQISQPPTPSPNHNMYEIDDSPPSFPVIIIIYYNRRCQRALSYSPGASPCMDWYALFTLTQ